MITMINAIEQYMNTLINEGKSDNTIKSYRLDLKYFLEFIEAQDSKGEGATGGTGVHSARKKDIEKYVEFLKSSGIAPATANRRIVSLRKFFEYLTSKGVIATNPAADIKVKAIQRQNTVKWQSREEVNRVLSAAETQSNAGSKKKIRDKALLSVAVNCGVRVSELCDLQLTDLNWNAEIVIVRKGKGDKYRMLPFGKAAQTAVKAWLEVRDRESDYVFTSERSDKMSTRAVQLVFEKLSEESGVKITPHNLRHTFGKNVVDKIGLQSAAEMLGHESIETTRIYSTPSMKEMAKAIEAIEFE